MYISGNLGNFSSRIHQLPRSVSDVDNFISEGDTYLNLITINLSGKWEKELRLKKYQLTHTPSYLSIPQLGQGSGIVYYIMDVSNNNILDVSNSPFAAA